MQIFRPGVGNLQERARSRHCRREGGCSAGVPHIKGDKMESQVLCGREQIRCCILSSFSNPAFFCQLSPLHGPPQAQLTCPSPVSALLVAQAYQSGSGLVTPPPKHSVCPGTAPISQALQGLRFIAGLVIQAPSPCMRPSSADKGGSLFQFQSLPLWDLLL